MGFLNASLADIWLQLIGFFLLYYAVTDGADLGVGIWSLFSRHPEEQRAMMASIGNIWHGNQTWLVILGGMLFGAFPNFYAILLSAVYVPIIIMIFGMIMRGVSFEFHEHSENKKAWSHVFGLGSLITTLAQGFALGGLLGGLTIREGQFAGSVWDWLSPYGAFIAAGVATGYLMLGANYLIVRTTGALQARCYRLAAVSGLITLLVSGGVHFWTTARYSHMAQKWATSTRWPLLLLSLGAAAAFVLYFLSLKQRRQLAPLLLNAAIIVLSFTGLSVGLYPHMIPGVFTSVLTVQEAAASDKTLFFMLVTTAILLPLILFYTGYNYWVFRGKTDQGYHDAGSE
jgi:cytochrome d ubiquinol oxidase subunit II